MRAAWLAGALLVLIGCRQPNPEWLGAADGSASSTTAVGTTTGPQPGTSGSSGASASSGSTTAADSSTGVETEGMACANDVGCPDGWVCGPMGCQLGMDGEPCTGNGDCQAPSDLCGPLDTCQDGGAGDPCAGNADCQAPTPLCGPLDMCQAGAAGDPCAGNVDCDGLTCTDSVCG